MTSVIFSLSILTLSYLLPLAAGRRTRGNSGGHLSFASFCVLASLFVNPRFSLSASLIATILHPTVLNSSCVLDVSLTEREWYFLGGI